MFLYVVVFMDLLLCKKLIFVMQVAHLGSVYHFRRLDEYPLSPNPSFLLPHLFFFPNRPPHGPYGYSPTCGWINILYERKLCVSDRMAEFGLFTCDSTCQ